MRSAGIIPAYTPTFCPFMRVATAVFTLTTVLLPQGRWRACTRKSSVTLWVRSNSPTAWNSMAVWSSVIRCGSPQLTAGGFGAAACTVTSRPASFPLRIAMRESGVKLPTNAPSLYAYTRTFTVCPAGSAPAGMLKLRAEPGRSPDRQPVPAPPVTQVADTTNRCGLLADVHATGSAADAARLLPAAGAVRAGASGTTSDANTRHSPTRVSRFSGAPTATGAARVPWYSPPPDAARVTPFTVTVAAPPTRTFCDRTPMSVPCTGYRAHTSGPPDAGTGDRDAASFASPSATTRKSYRSPFFRPFTRNDIGPPALPGISGCAVNFCPSRYTSYPAARASPGHTSVTAPSSGSTSSCGPSTARSTFGFSTG